LRSACRCSLAATLPACALASDRLRRRRLVGLSTRFLAAALPAAQRSLHHLLHQRPEDAGPTTATTGTPADSPALEASADGGLRPIVIDIGLIRLLIV
jgi:hypothetical protein